VIPFTLGVNNITLRMLICHDEDEIMVKWNAFLEVGLMTGPSGKRHSYMGWQWFQRLP
jgi:hypothetical protein